MIKTEDVLLDKKDWEALCVRGKFNPDTNEFEPSQMEKDIMLREARKLWGLIRKHLSGNYFSLSDSKAIDTILKGK